MNRPLVTGQDPNAAALAAKHFNTATPENDLKWQLVHPQPNQYNWEPADSYVAFGEKNKMFVVGHCLVWHSQDPQWVFRDDAGNALTRDALLARMKDHITTVVGHYKGRVKGWDVVNEALDDSGTMRNTACGSASSAKAQPTRSTTTSRMPSGGPMRPILRPSCTTTTTIWKCRRPSATPPSPS